VQALDGDLKAMLEMANCLPRVILDRISAQEHPVGSSLLRTAGPSNGPEEPIPGLDHALAFQLKEFYGLDNAQAGALALAIDGLVNLDHSQRANLFSLIATVPHYGTAHIPNPEPSKLERLWSGTMRHGIPPRPDPPLRPRIPY